MIWSNENNHRKSPWDDETPKENAKIPQQNIEDLFRQFAFGKGKFKNNKPNNFGNFNSKKLIFALLLVLSFICLSTSFYVVDEGEQALVIRFGKYVRTATTGLNFHLPEPIETIVKEKVETLRKEEIGFRSGNGGRDNNAIENYSVNAVSASNVLQESLMLTGDENIIDINFIIQWKIANLKDYVFNIYNPRETVRSVAESSMREIIGSTPIDKAITDGRSAVEIEAKILLQKTLDSYHSGVEITALKLLRADPPSEVIDAFRDVQTAKTDKEREINKAYAFENEILPRARGEAAKIKLESEAYKQEIIERATGDAGRFDLVFNQYKNAKDITRKRLYLESMEAILPGMDKVIIDNKNTILPYLPLNQLDKGK